MNEEQILLKLTALCSSAEYCSNDLREKMRRWQISEDVQEKVLAYLIREKYVDDERFCRLFVKDKLRFNKWGRRKIALALAQKRIPQDIASAVLDEVPDSDYLAILRPLLRQKARTVKAESDYDRNGKLVRYAMSRGFTFDLIRQCLTGDVEEPDE